ncbi:MAG: hypothetical protein WDO71_06735 [Bacteroidota bacterium]
MRNSYVILLGMLLMANGCGSKKAIKFEQKKWNETINRSSPSPNRERMLNDLLENHKLVGLTCNELISLLGDPNWNDSASLTYKIVVDFRGDIDPVYTKSLEFYFSKDSVITAFDIIELAN